MQRDENASSATAVAETLGSSATASQNKIFSMIFSFLSVLHDLFSFITLKIVHFAVNQGTTFHSRVLVPSAVWIFAFSSIAAVFITRARDYLRIRFHSATIAFATLRANRFALAVSLFAITVTIIISTFYSVGIKITVDGEELGYMDSREEYNESIRFVEDRATEILGRPYSVTVPVKFELGIVSRDNLIPKDTIRSYFFSRINEISALYAITVDGEVVGASHSREVLQGMLDELLYTSDPNVNARFAQDVQITQRYVDASKLISYDEIRAKLTSTIHTSREYTIKPGDTLDKIAKANGMTTAELCELNPSLTSKNLRAGKKVTVAKEVPFLSVEAVRHVEYTENIPYETKEVKDASIYRGQSKVVTQGRYGTRKVVADVTYVDNKEVKRTIISSTVVSQPVTKVVHVGTKTPPKTVATGKLSRPISGGIISSNYGMRRGSMHKGVDFAAKTGTRISAADGGTVTWAGWKRGGWGYLVVINHGNGIETYYAHNSRVTVKVGQKVAKGQEIAKMGSTGNSSGPHVHFEVHVNGRYVNPWKYIK